MNLQNFNLSTVKNFIDARDTNGLKTYISEFGLEIREGKILPMTEHLAAWQNLHDFYDKRQLVRKILLNSAYGALLNTHMRFYDIRIGQSTTLNGRQIVKHMSAHLNEQIAGEYDHNGEAIVYGDSVTADTIIRTDTGSITIEKLFNMSLEKCISDDKEYGVWNDAKVLGFNSETMEPITAKISYVMRHKTKKKLYRITTENGKQVTVTEDHSLIVDRDGFLVECKPTDIRDTDLIITFDPSA
jgi:hypothetical protein